MGNWAHESSQSAPAGCPGNAPSDHPGHKFSSSAMLPNALYPAPDGKSHAKFEGMPHGPAGRSHGLGKGWCLCLRAACGVPAEMGPLGCWVTPGLARDWKVLERVLEGGERKSAACPASWAARPLDHRAWHVSHPGLSLQEAAGTGKLISP